MRGPALSLGKLLAWLPAKTRSLERVFLPQRRRDAEEWPRWSAALQKLVALETWILDFGCLIFDLGKGSRAPLTALSYILSPARRLGAYAVVVAILELVAPGARAQLILERTVAVGATIPDRGQYVSTFGWADAGLNSISRVSVDLNLSSPSVTNPMWLGDMYGSLTHGTALTGARTVTLFDFPQADPNNGATSLSASYSTTGLNGSWLSTNTWSLLVADREAGGVGRLDSWKIRVEGEARSGGTIAVHSGGTLLLGAANQISESTQVTMAGGVLDTAGFGDAVGKLTVTAASTIRGLAAAGGGSDFTFSDIDLGNYSTSSGSTLTLLPTSGTYGLGTVIQLSSVSASSWTGYGDGTSLNNFAQKISFSDANLRAQINFGGETSGTTLTVAAIPDARVAAAAVVLIILIGWTEVRRGRLWGR